ncbi:MAG: hypothetical protein AXA67_11545 [Methylothermaceae bacteria B42]|nr:MAG: hypothetical protein AXA67_11545 [Methylothermaceae bacteria B42]
MKWMEKTITQPFPEPVQSLVEAIRRSYGEHVVAVLMYGSCLRSGDPFDGLVDLYVLVDDYNKAYRKRWLSWANRLLPPNVFYLEANYQGRTLRAKYAVITAKDFERGMRWFHSYLWGRFSQPCLILHIGELDKVDAVLPKAEQSIPQWVAKVLIKAAATFVTNTVPMLPPCFDVRTLWTTGLQLSYGAELRAEMGESRANQLFDYAKNYYQTLTPFLIQQLPYAKKKETESYCLEIPETKRLRCRILWKVRRLQGKILSLLRLIKALFTFQGGVDYIIWKLERHSGRTIEVPPKVRRHPLVFGWVMLWRLYRQGIFR